MLQENNRFRNLFANPAILPSDWSKNEIRADGGWHRHIDLHWFMVTSVAFSISGIVASRSTLSTSEAKQRSSGDLNIRFAFTVYRCVTCVSEIPVFVACAQISCVSAWRRRKIVSGGRGFHETGKNAAVDASIIVQATIWGDFPVCILPKGPSHWCRWVTFPSSATLSPCFCVQKAHR